MAASPQLSKREKREARKAAREEKRGKEARKLVEPPLGREIRFEAAPATTKAVRIGADPDSVKATLMTWSVDTADREGQWSWGSDRAWSDSTWDSILHPKLRSFGTMTWSEIELARVKGKKKKTRAAHHDQQVASICDEAQARLKHLDLIHDLIFRFRLGSQRRLWGFRALSCFNLLWYDPTHQIYPTEP
jgi:hypothetical protein